MRSDKTLRNFLHQFLPRALRRNLKNLFHVVATVLDYGRLTLTGIARKMRTGKTLKSNFKLVDRLINNPVLHNSLIHISKAIAEQLLQGTPTLIVDWTPCGQGHHAIVLSLPHRGRTIPIYFQVHPERLLGNTAVERSFLDLVQNQILPPGLQPLLITDAGFRNPWFRQALERGWHVLGRSLSRVKARLCHAEGEVWWDMTLLHNWATSTPTDHGWWWASKSSPTRLRLVSVKREAVRKPSQKREKRKAPRTATERQHRRRGLQPWMLWTSLKEANAADVVRLYSQRMWIEEQFRDDKSASTGVGLGSSESGCPSRLTGLRMLGQLVTLFSHTVGVVGEERGWSKRYQSNTVSDRRELSLPYLGRQLWFHEDRRRLPLARLNAALHTIRDEYTSSWKTIGSQMRLAA